MYTAGKNNQKADILSRREQDVAAQELVKLDSRSRTLLGPARLDPRINAELAEVFINQTVKCILAPLGPVPDDPDLIRDLKAANQESFKTIREELPPNYTVDDENLLLFKNRLCIQRNTPLCTRLMREAHDQVSSAHPSALKTYQLLTPKYYWEGMTADCKQYVRNCGACRRSHSNQTKQQGWLHPLPIPAYPMQHMCMDFKEFPKDKEGYDAILVFIDRLGKDSVTIPCHKTIDARGLAVLFIQWIYRFGHTPESIVSDRGPQFVSAFWKEFCRIIGVKIKLSTAYHKETDGQTEIMNRYIDQRLRPFVSYYQDNWSSLLPMMDRVQMTLPHSSIGMAPYRLKFGIEPRTSWDWNTPKPVTPAEKLNFPDAVAVATRMHKAWEIAKANMEKAQEAMSKSVNKHRRAIDWKVGDKVYLSAKNLKVERPSRKLSDQWKGPYDILEQIGNSYRLKLPEGSAIHDVFAPDVLTKDSNDPLPGQEMPKPSGEVIAGQEEYDVDEILAVKLVRGDLFYRASWIGHDPDPSWYPARDFMGSPHKLRDFHLAYPEKPGPPRRLNEWIKAWEDGVDDLNHLADDKPVQKTRRSARKAR
jgi:transposase InsO family protein